MCLYLCVLVSEGMNVRTVALCSGKDFGFATARVRSAKMVKDRTIMSKFFFLDSMLVGPK